MQGGRNLEIGKENVNECLNKRSPHELGQAKRSFVVCKWDLIEDHDTLTVIPVVLNCSMVLQCFLAIGLWLRFR